MDSWQVIATEPLEGDVSMERFRHAIEIYWEKPHCANKKVCGAVEISEDQLPDCIPKVMCERLRKIIAKKTSQVIYEGRIDDSTGVQFHPLNEVVSVHPSVPYQFSMVPEGSSWSLRLSILHSPGESQSVSENCGSRLWLMNVLMPRIVRWTTVSDPGQPAVIRHSLTLITLENYSRTYEHLKTKYGKSLCEMWSEKTDPQKYVYEDIAIAAYLLTLWEQEADAGKGPSYQSFVDIGCGNGLLVYLLCSEGHKGYGMDLRRRKIWDHFGTDVKLVERCYVPSDDNLFPDTNWLIGNHSDELTPWLPVMAMKSHKDCQFFVIPCCTFDFYGRFDRKGAVGSRYRSYLQYIRRVGETCGFQMDEDTLKIPSTKRVCFVGRRSGKIYADVKDQISELIEASRGSNKRSATTDTHEVEPEPPQSSQSALVSPEVWKDNFKPRDKVEAIRNCTALPKALLSGIVLKVAQKLLETSDYQQYTTADDHLMQWNKGGSISITDCVQLVTEEERHSLKLQFGGMRTLLRNHRHVFQVVGDLVKLRNWLEESAGQPTKSCSRPCWFYLNHPDKCALGKDCRFAHTTSDSPDRSDEGVPVAAVPSCCDISTGSALIN